MTNPLIIGCETHYLAIAIVTAAKDAMMPKDSGDRRELRLFFWKSGSFAGEGIYIAVCLLLWPFS